MAPATGRHRWSLPGITLADVEPLELPDRPTDVAAIDLDEG